MRSTLIAFKPLNSEYDTAWAISILINFADVIFFFFFLLFFFFLPFMGL